MIEVGQPAPDFTLPDQDGTPWTLSALRGGPVVLYFYPKDNTPGCTSEASDFRDRLDACKSAGATVLGVSPDGAASHRRFAEKHALNFPLLADTDKAVCQAYGVWKEKTLYGRKSLGVERTTFLIDADGVVRRVFPRVRVAGHVDAVLAAMGELRAPGPG